MKRPLYRSELARLVPSTPWTDPWRTPVPPMRVALKDGWAAAKAAARRDEAAGGFASYGVVILTREEALAQQVIDPASGIPETARYGTAEEAHTSGSQKVATCRGALDYLVVGSYLASNSRIKS